MPIDYDAVRKAFYGSPLPSPPQHLPTREEILAEHQRICLQVTDDLGVDPSTAAVGEYGSLIGGTGKPLTVIARPIGRLLRLEPMPLEWFDHPRARRAWNGGVADTAALHERIEFLEQVIRSHLAGFPDPPTATELASWIECPASLPRGAGAVYNIFENIPPGQCARMLSKGHFSVYEVARVIIHSEARSPELIAWLHQFAVDPKQKYIDDLDAGRTVEPAPDSPAMALSG
ncbi:MAG: hypothetical protein OXN96_03155 [Bryobacterales bacterium]|nr:hypothetical protein [Bryobacterales bacterium]MDE0620694.1 hypothetical protein [Bryobacterales bacterium]